MFQYAFGRSLADRLGVELAVDLSDTTLQIHNGFELDTVFNIHVKIATKTDLHAVLGWQRFKFIRNIIVKPGRIFAGVIRYIVEPHFHFASEMLRLPDKVYLDGYWQSEKYFFQARENIRREFAFRYPPSEINEITVSELLNTDETTISLHVRRGDFINNPTVHQVHGVCSLDYYRAAIHYLVARIKHPRFYVFSDDLEWANSNLNLSYPHVFISHNRGKTSYEDMRLMSLCHHHIIANSSFSWWGAWLNPSPEKIIVAPKNWFVTSERNSQDVIPEGWITL